ncbi:MAG: molybdopterin-guanine dinucleotide biosynthesis protein B [Gammaproteobacteria bacterium]|nr:molybdopterin-guanine dinucleotide biosynthesis protein B [Gammaproteobacteria bacterium]
MIRSFQGVPIVGVAAWSGTGKTTLLSRLIPLLRQEGIRCAVVKHAHHSFEIDYPGKDSHAFRRAGAEQVLVGSARRWALIVETEPDSDESLGAFLPHLQTDTLDLIIVEGFKPEMLPKIELYRPVLGKPPLNPGEGSIIAVATDAPEQVDTSLPVLDINDAAQIGQFIIATVLPAAREEMTGEP